MKRYPWFAGLLTTAMSMLPASLTAQGVHGGGTTVAYVAVAFAGEHMGRFPASNCAPGPGGSVAAGAFQETTPAFAPAEFGSFDMTISGACVVPYFEALLAHEPMTVTMTLSSADGTPLMNYSLKNAKFTHVGLSLGNGAPNPFPLLRLSVSSPEVALAVGGPTEASSSVSAAGPSSSQPSRLKSGRTPALRKRSRAPILPLSVERLRNDRLRRIAVAPPSSALPSPPTGLGAGWLAVQSSGDRGAQTVLYLSATLAATSPQLDATVPVKPSLNLDASYPVDAGTLMPAGRLQIALSPLVTATNPATMVALGNAARAHARLTQGKVVLWKADGTPTPGITVTLRGGRFISYQVTAASGGPQSQALQTLQLDVDGFTITDIGSGKTAICQP